MPRQYETYTINKALFISFINQLMAPASHQHAFALLFFFIASSFYLAIATDPSQLQDFCVGMPSEIFINGLVCKNPKEVTPEDFFFDGLVNPGNTNNALGSAVTPAFVAQFPGLNTFGISLARIDFAPYGENPPHTHPRATEVLTLIEGQLLVGFVTSNPNNTLFAKVLYKGQNYVFPQGLIHFQFNVGKYPAVALAALSSQNPGVITIADATFGSNPPIEPEVLAKAFKIDAGLVKILQSKFAKTST